MGFRSFNARILQVKNNIITILRILLVMYEGDLEGSFDGINDGDADGVTEDNFDQFMVDNSKT